MQKTAEKPSPSSRRQKRGARRTCLGGRCAHTFVTDLFATLSALRDALVRIYSPAGITEHKFAVLSALAAQAPAPSLATQLARTAGITRASMTDLLDDLEHRGWIDRSRDRADRRVVHVHLTALGQEVVDTTNAHFETLCRDLLGGVRPQELNRVTHLCTLMRHASQSLPARMPPLQLPSQP